MKKYVFLIFICLTLKGLSQNILLIDSILNQIQLNHITLSLANKALVIPYDKITNELNKSLVIFETLEKSEIFKSNKIAKGDLFEKLALVYYLKGDYIKSGNSHLKSIAIFEKENDLKRKANAMAASAYESKRRNLKSSLILMGEATQILKSVHAYNDLASAYNNYGVLFELNNNLDSAMFYYQIAIKIKTQNNDSVAIPYSLNNIAGIYFMEGNIKEGLNYIEKSNQIRNALKDYVGIAWNELSLGELYLSLGEDIKAKTHFQKSLFYSQKVSYPDLKARNLKFIALIMAKQLKYDSAYIYFTTFFNIHDSIYNEQTQKKLIEMETLYDSEKKISQINTLNSKNELKEKELKSKQIELVFLLGILILSVVAGLIIFKAYRQKNKANNIIVQQKKDVEVKNYIIEEKQKEILDSINYAKRIQDTLLPSTVLLSNNLNQHFVLFNPKDIVSGDFYWATENHNKFYLAVCDCTGHGVPGAFMSLLNMGFMSEAIKEKNIVEPGEIFNYVRDRLINSISKEGQQDGMDGILLCIDKNSKQITYCAANNEPILISNTQILELPKNKMPVGKGEKTDSFTTHTIQAKAGDVLYLYTDGYADQFGGPKGKKFKYKALNELLISLKDVALEKQKEILNLTLLNWKGNLEQVDDILIVGIKI